MYWKMHAIYCIALSLNRRLTLGLSLLSLLVLLLLLSSSLVSLSSLLSSPSVAPPPSVVAASSSSSVSISPVPARAARSASAQQCRTRASTGRRRGSRSRLAAVTLRPRRVNAQDRPAQVRGALLAAPHPVERHHTVLQELPSLLAQTETRRHAGAPTAPDDDAAETGGRAS